LAPAVIYILTDQRRRQGALYFISGIATIHKLGENKKNNHFDWQRTSGLETTEKKLQKSVEKIKLLMVASVYVFLCTCELFCVPFRFL
jgi:hypothetical protein